MDSLEQKYTDRSLYRINQISNHLQLKIIDCPDIILDHKSNHYNKDYSSGIKLIDYPYIMPCSVFFRDCDMYMHVNNATYYHYFDNLFNTFFVEEGLMNTNVGEVIGIVAANECNYISDLVFPQRLLLGLRTVKIGRTSTIMEAVIFKNINTRYKQSELHKKSNQKIDVNSDEWQIAAVSKFVWVFCTRIYGQKMRPTNIPENIKKALLRVFSGK